MEMVDLQVIVDSVVHGPQKNEETKSIFNFF
jgi:hypothetical protein